MTISLRIPETGETYDLPDEATEEQIMDFYKSKVSSLKSEKSSSSGKESLTQQFKEQFPKVIEQSSRVFGVPNAVSVATRNPVKNIRDVAQGAVQAPIHLGQLLTPDQSSLGKKLEAANQSTSRIGSGENGMLASEARGIGASIPWAFAGGPIGRAVPMASSGVKSILGQMIAGGAQGASETGNGGNKILNTLIGTAAGAIPGGVLGAAEKLRPSKIIKASLSPEEISKNLDAAGGSRTDLGKIIGNPTISRNLENIASKLWGSGQPEAAARTRKYISNKSNDLVKDILGTNDIESHGETLKNKGENILNDLKGDTTSKSILKDIQEDLKGKYNEKKNTSDSLYRKRNKIADEDPNFLMASPDFEKNAPSINDEEGKGKLLNSILSDSPELKKSYEKLRGDVSTEGSFEKSYQPQRIFPSLGEATLLKGKLNQAAKSLKLSPDMTQRYQSGIVGNLAKNIDTGIKNSIDESGNLSLKEAHEIADKHYSKELSPFYDKDLYKIIEGKKFDPDTLLNKTVKTGEGKDMANNISKLTDILGHDNTKLAYSYLAPAIDGNGNVDLDVLSKRWDKLGDRQKEALISSDSKRKDIDNLVNQNKLHKIFKPAIQEGGKVNPSKFSNISDKLLSDKSKLNDIVPNKKTQQKMSDLSRLVGFHQKNQAFNPPTGQETMDLLVPAAVEQFAESAASNLSPLAKKIVGLASYAYAGKAIKPLVRSLTSPKGKRDFIKKMQNPKNKFNTKNKVIAGNALTQALLNTTRQGSSND